ncbi:MAG: hypothetical protein RJA07_1646 [Bacteroidota bacterium]|jgi:para-aminobenzoate synthetase component 1
MLDNNGYANYPFQKNEFIIAAGVKKEIRIANDGDAFHQFEKFKNENKNEFIFGFFTYDLKNEIEKLSSINPDYIDFPALYFFIPQHIVKINSASIEIKSDTVNEILDAIKNCNSDLISNQKKSIQFNQRTSKAQYISDVNALKEHIRNGTIYEINYCQEFFAEDVVINPIEIFRKLNTKNGGSFSSYFKLNKLHALCTSPERFICKQGEKIISQPIKGTKKIGATEEENLVLKQELFNDEKERAENVMIVDLVRNDLAKSAIIGSVNVDELFGIYSYKTVHQMISTISAIKKENINEVEIIKNAFPMGSMTGAPKYTTMQLIEKYEKIKRGLYSGSIGYFEPNGDFDFNVVIRTLLYNEAKKYLSYSTGSAITLDAEAEKEYEECLLKATSLFEIFN